MLDSAHGKAVSELNSLTINDLLKEIERYGPNFLPLHLETVLQKIDYKLGDRLRAKLDALPVFAHRPIEELIDEIATLLPKCLVYRDNKLDLEVKAIDLWLELRQFFLEDAIRDKQIAAGEFDLAADLANADRQAFARAVQHSEASQNAYEAAQESRDPKSTQYTERVDATRQAVQLSSYSSAAKVGEAAARLAKSQILYEMPPLTGSAESAAAAAGAEFRYAFQSQDVGFRKELKHVKKETALLKALAARQSGSGMNFTSRITEAQQLFDSDFISALARATSLRKGLLEVFFIDAPLPPIGNNSALINLIMWLRERMDQLAQIADRQLRIEVEHSIRRSVSAEEWAKFVGTGQVEMDFTPAVLDGLGFIRLRRAGLFITGTPKGTFRARLKVPSVAVYRYGRKTEAKLDQSDIPSLILAAVRTRVQPQDVIGDECRSILNSSPLGRWTICLEPTSTRGEAIANIEDVVLCLSLKALPQ